MRTWSDASGVDRIVAVFCLSDSGWRWTRATVSERFIDDLLPRGDNYIGILELMAPILALGTWPGEFVNKLWTAWIDNQGALHALLKGSCGSPEMNILVGRMWLSLEVRSVSLFAARVESAANVADGPTRHCLEWVQRLNATFDAPCWPAWAGSLWSSDANFCYQDQCHAPRP